MQDYLHKADANIIWFNEYERWIIEHRKKLWSLFMHWKEQRESVSYITEQDPGSRIQLLLFFLFPEFFPNLVLVNS